MLQNLRKRNEGFTIIEVLIVLAIAGLILLVVFLAVPALQRNSRNTQRKNDVQAVLGGVTDFMANNAGALPTGFSSNQVTGATGTTASGAKIGYYTAVTFGTGAATAPTGASITDTLTIRTGAKCSASDAVAGSARQVVAMYAVEAGDGSLATKCQDS